MRPETIQWLHEARVAIDSSLREFTSCNSMNAPACESLFTGVEKAIKATVIEKYGGVPKSFQTHSLVTICQSNGVWGMLPPPLQNFVQTMVAYGPETRYPSEPAHQRLLFSTNLEWETRLKEAGTLLDFLVNRVIPKLIP